jgi:DNA-binding MarR family transcriptional regulator
VVQAVRDAVGSVHDPTEPTSEVTVGVVADRLGIDPSTASRVVAETIRDGFLARSLSAVDGRRTCLELTEAGRDLDAASRRYQRGVFDRATLGWSASERRLFAGLFVQFAAAIGELQSSLGASLQSSEERGEL